MSDWGLVYTALHESDALLQQSSTILLRISRWYENESGKTRNVLLNMVIRHENAPKSCFDNRMASMQMRLMDCLTAGERKQLIYGLNEIILVLSCLPGFV